jgi:hypothetical protein
VCPSEAGPGYVFRPSPGDVACGLHFPPSIRTGGGGSARGRVIRAASPGGSLPRGKVVGGGVGVNPADRLWR